MDIPGALGILIAVLTIAGIAGGLAAFFRSMQRATLETYKEDNEALRLRVDTLEKERIDDRGHIDTLRAEVTKLRADNDLLREIVPGTQAIKALHDTVADQHSQVMAALRVVGGAIADMGREQ